jgi:hypothetical protein
VSSPPGERRRTDDATERVGDADDNPVAHAPLDGSGFPRRRLAAGILYLRAELVANLTAFCGLAVDTDR